MVRGEPVTRRAAKFREPDVYRWYPTTSRAEGRRNGLREMRTDTPAASIDFGPPKTYRRPRGGDVGPTEEAELLGRLAEIEKERQDLVDSLSANHARKDTLHKHSNCFTTTFLDTYRPPNTSRTMLLPGEGNGKIYSH